jgi:hypothetical protein
MTSHSVYLPTQAFHILVNIYFIVKEFAFLWSNSTEVKENWRILTNKEIYATVKKPTITETIRLHRLHWFGHVQRKEENRIPKRVLYMNLESTRPRGRPRNR